MGNAGYNVGAWIEGRIGNKFALAEGAAFVTGDGNAKPRGILTYEAVTDGDSPPRTVICNTLQAALPARSPRLTPATNLST